MFNNNMVMIISNSEIKLYAIDIKRLSKKHKDAKLLLNCSIYDYDKIKSFIKGKKLTIVNEGEELFIRLLKLPKIKNGIDSMVKNEIMYIFKEIDELMYAYTIIAKSKQYINIVAYCINGGENKFNDFAKFSCSLRGVYLIQLCILEYIFKQIMASNFIIIVNYNNNIYILACIKKVVIADSIIKGYKGEFDSIKEKLDIINLKTNEIMEELFLQGNKKNLYLLNFYDEKVETLKPEYNCINMGNIDLDKVFMEAI
jgi:hypothetical protein